MRSYRYVWAERAKAAGMPERFAQEALGQNSKAVHRAYAKRVDDKAASANAQLNARTQRCFGGRLLEVLLAKKEW